jgi:hypothetical protein
MRASDGVARLAHDELKLTPEHGEHALDARLTERAKAPDIPSYRRRPSRGRLRLAGEQLAERRGPQARRGQRARRNEPQQPAARRPGRGVVCHNHLCRKTFASIVSLDIFAKAS